MVKRSTIFLLWGCWISLTAIVGPSIAAESFEPSPSEEAAKILTETGVQGGFVVHLGIGDGKLTKALQPSAAFQVQGLDRDPMVVNSVRASLRASGGYGDVSVERLIGAELPYIDNLVNLFVAEKIEGISMEEIHRVLVPNGVAYIRNADGKWSKSIKPRPKNIDEWSHYLHDASGNAVAHDDVVAPPRHLQWVGSPRYSRHHDRMASMIALVSTNW